MDLMINKTSIFNFISLFLLLHHNRPIGCLEENFEQSLDAIFHDHAFRAMTCRHHPRTGALYNTALPKRLSGMKVSVVRLRSRTLWRKGANFSSFVIPPRTRPVPHVKRIIIVYHDLGNLSSLYYNISGYSLVSPVVGFSAYDASNLSIWEKLELNNTLGEPVRVEFQSPTPGTDQRRFCASFGDFGRFSLVEMGSSDYECYVKNEGHFSIVVALNQQREKIRLFWLLGLAAGVVGVVAVAMAIGSFVGKNREMVKGENEAESLQSYWIGDSKMPRAKVTRTRPVLESATPNPKVSWYA